MRWILIFCTFFLFTSEHQSSRAPSSLRAGNCIELMEKLLVKSRKNAFGKVSSFVKEKVITPTLDKLSKHSLKAKLQFLKVLNARRGRIKVLSEMYANTINGMLTRKMIKPEDVPDLLVGNGQKKYILEFAHGEVRVSPKSWLGLPNLDETMDMILARTQPSVGDVLQLRKLLTETEFTPLEFNEFQKYFVRFPKDQDEWNVLKEYLHFASSMRSKKQLKAMAELPKLFYEADSGKHINKFRSIRKGVEKYRTKQIKKQAKKALKKGMTKEQAEAFAKVEAKRMSEIYSGLKYSCRSTKPTAESKQAAKATSKFFMGMGITATAGTYAYSNWDKDKTEFDWYGKLGHDLTWKFIFQYGFNKIMTDQSATMLKKSIVVHAFYTPADAIEAGMYEVEFGKENAFIKEEYERILKLRKEEDPNFIKEYNKAMSSLNTVYFQDKIKILAKELLSGEKVPPVNDFDEILSLKEVGTGELEDEELQERLMEAIALSIYNDDSGRVKLGGHFLDRYIFVRSYDMLDVPKSLFMGLWIYRTMCMGGLNMKNAILQASLIYTIDSVISKFIYYQIRRDVINM